MARAHAVLTLTGVLVVLVYSANASADAALKVILQQPFVSPGPKILVTSVILTIPPGDDGAAPHYHSGPLIGYVIEGELLYQVLGGPPRILPEGEAFYEQDGITHIWGGNASNKTTCKIFSTVFGRPDQPFITFIDGYNRGTREEALALAKKNEDSGSKPYNAVNPEWKE